MSKISLLIIISVLFNVIYSLSIPMRNSTYPFKSDCEGDGKSEIPTQVNDCIDHHINRKFKCCYVEVNDLTTGEPIRVCMRVKKNNKTDLNQLKDFVSTQGLYSVVTCNENYLKNSILIFLIFLLFL